MCQLKSCPWHMQNIVLTTQPGSMEVATCFFIQFQKCYLADCTNPENPGKQTPAIKSWNITTSVSQARQINFAAEHFFTIWEDNPKVSSSPALCTKVSWVTLSPTCSLCPTQGYLGEKQEEEGILCTLARIT